MKSSYSEPTAVASKNDNFAVSKKAVFRHTQNIADKSTLLVSYPSPYPQ